MRCNSGFKSRPTDTDTDLYAIDVAKIRDGAVRITLRQSTPQPPFKYKDMRIELTREQAAHIASTIVKNLV